MLVRLLCLFAVFAFVAPLRADEAADKAKDIGQMKKIWEAIQAFRKAKGDVPKHLSDLFPDFLSDKSLLVSPRGADGKLGDSEMEDPTLPCSYGYEFVGQGKGSIKEARKKQMEEFGDIVPIMRCYLYDKVISISYGGEVFETEANWERSAFAKDWLVKHNIEPGMKNAEQLTITVVGKDGKPIPDVTIKATERSSGVYDLPDRTLTTTADGTAILPVSKSEDAGAKLSFSKNGLASLPRYWPVRDRDGNADPAAKPVLRVTMFAGGAASGVVSGQDGKPIAGARVWLSPLDEKGEPTSGENLTTLTPTGADGRWEIKEVPAGGNFKLSVNHPAHRFYSQKLGENGAPNFEAMLSGKGDFVILPPYSITGTVSAAGKPIADATVWMSSVNGYPIAAGATGADGTFKIAWTQEPKGNVIAFAKGYAPQRFPVANADKPIAAAVEHGRAMKGRVRDQAGDPVPNVPILLARFDNTYLRLDMPVIAKTDAQGDFVWPDAPKAVVSLLALLPSGAQWNFQWDCNLDKPADIKVPVQPE